MNMIWHRQDRKDASNLEGFLALLLPFNSTFWGDLQARKTEQENAELRSTLAHLKANPPRAPAMSLGGIVWSWRIWTLYLISGGDSQAYFCVLGSPPKVKPPPVNLMGWTLVPNWCWGSQWMGWLSFEHPVGIKESQQALTSFQALRTWGSLE